MYISSISAHVSRIKCKRGTSLVCKCIECK